jgi:hypothetical protein
MIKTSIIFILIFLLLITLYSYYCLSYYMVNFERIRLEYILQKEYELNKKENKIKIIQNCSNKNENYKEALNNINNIIINLDIMNNKSDIDNNLITNSNIDINFIKQKLNTKILNEESNEKILNEESNEEQINLLNDTKILNEVPIEYSK